MIYRMSWAETTARRLGRSGLAGSGAAEGGAAEGGPAAVAAAVCGVHAQVLSAAELSVALRLDGATRADVRRALRSPASPASGLVKTYGPRGTVHSPAAADLALWTGALSALPTGSGNGAGGIAKLLTPGQADAVVAAIGDALAGAELTVDELIEAVAERAGSWAADPVMDASGL